MYQSAFHRFKTFLAQPYPFYYRGRLLWTSSLIILVTVFFFNYLFEPFVVYVPEHRMNFVFICVIHAIIPAVFYWVYFSLIQLKRGVDERWTVLSEIVGIFCLLVLIGIAQFLIRDVIYNNPDNWSWRYFFEEIRNALMVGIFFSFFFVPLNFNRLYRQNREHAEALLPVPMQEADRGGLAVPIQTQVKSDDFVLDPNLLLFVRAEKNYVEIHLLHNLDTIKLLKRISMKELESQLSSVPFLVKTHRSYLVNMLVIENVSGNAQGYRLKLKQCDELVPVSRNMISGFEEKRKIL